MPRDEIGVSPRLSVLSEKKKKKKKKKTVRKEFAGMAAAGSCHPWAEPGGSGGRGDRLELYKQCPDQAMHSRSWHSSRPLARTALIGDLCGRLCRAQHHVELQRSWVSLAIVRWPGEPRRHRPTVTTISVITSMLLYVGCYLGAPLYSTAMGAPSATNVVRTLALVIVIDGFATAPIGLLQRYFRSKDRRDDR